MRIKSVVLAAESSEKIQDKMNETGQAAVYIRLCSFGVIMPVFSGNIYSRCKLMQSPLPQPIFVFHFSPTHCLCYSSDSEVTNTLKVPVARGKTVKQNYMLERSFIIVNVAFPKQMSQL